MTTAAQNIGLIEVVSIIVGLFVVLGVFLALAKWIMYLTIKPIWEKLKDLDAENKALRKENGELALTVKEQKSETTNKLTVAGAENRAIVSQSMTEVVGEVANVSKHYSEFQQQIEALISALRLELAKDYVMTKDLEREFEICRKTTHGVS
jgi:predicted nuclease with TOPRIM domain